MSFPSSPNISTNGSTPSFRPPVQPPTKLTTTDYVMTVLFAILMFFILIENILVLASFRVNRRLRTKTNYFILSLAFADLLIGIISVPYYVYTLYVKQRNDFYIFWISLDVIIGVSSIMNLTMISMERAYALLRPIQHRSISKATIVWMIVAAWSLGGIAGSAYFTLTKLSLKNVKIREAFQKLYGIILFIVFFAVPLTVIIVTYSIIFKIASAHARGRGVRSFKKDLRIATTVAVVIGCFTINWLPFFSLNLFFTVCRYYSIKVCWSVPPILGTVTKLMQYGNSVCNPLIYGFRNKDFKITFKKIIYKLFGKDVAISTYTHSTHTTRHTRKMMRAESSYGDSIVYPDQMVPNGMYDMRNSYRNAVTKGPSKKHTQNKQKKGLAQGLMALNVQTFSMGTEQSTSQLPSPISSDVPTSQSEEVLLDTVDRERQLDAVTSHDVEVYPIDESSLVNPRVKGKVNVAFRDSMDIDAQSIGNKSNSSSRVHFDLGNGVVNGGLSNDDTQNDLTVSDDKERSYSLKTMDSPDVTKHTERRSLTFT